ncbi:pyridoxal phosphate-dependent decarboxylase family protein [Chthonobacter albigriseus]|uniref:pyridoxal phosphate-dependent decarboxylase family protein n=1 Tax=Chthonobacter albigriseus TaxID=1683161 RepID=UPI0015EEE91A|nr:pyridoxal-dependent decarboxylase [Chthonobacter albigriseus]
MDDLTRALEIAAASGIDYRRRLPDRPQRPELSYADVLSRFRRPLPEAGEGGSAVIRALGEAAAPGLHAHAGPRFFGWVIGGSHPVGVAADWLAGAWGQNAGNHQAAPSAAAAEAASAEWLLDLLDLPRESSVGFVTGATMANFVCLAAARGEVLRRVGWDVESKGLFGAPPVTVLIGDEAHATVYSALQYLGFGRDGVRRIASDAEGRIRPDAFSAATSSIEGPVICVLQAGQINTGAFDPFDAIVPVARRASAWIHVDGAFGLWARACPPRKALTEGLQNADSWAVDGHKWLQTPYDSGYAIIRDAIAHERAMTTAASYLPVAAGGERDPSHFVPELSRRARGFATWAMILHLGRSGIAAMVERHCRLAARMAERLVAEPGIEIANAVVLDQVAVRFGKGLPIEEADTLTDRVIAAVQADGTCFAGGALWKGRRIMRVSVIDWATGEADIDASADAILRCWRAVRN